MENSFYIPINSGSLAHYFNRAIILPAKYYTNKPEDIQDSAGDFILLSNSKWVKNSDCAIEIILTDLERDKLIRASDDFSYCNTPIPISRVKSVCFLDAKQKETTIWNINNGAAFIPEGIVSVETRKNIGFVSDDQVKPINQQRATIDFSDKIKRFDIILGGFAFMRLGGKPFMNYSQNYFATLSYFNKLIEEQTYKAANEKGFVVNNKYTGLFSKNESEWTKWLQYIYQNLEPQDVENIALKEGKRIEKRLGLLSIDLINTDSHLYELAILATYGDRKNKSTDNLVTDLTNGTINSDKAEDVSILFGLNNGYSKLRNKYKGTVKDRYVKFKMESKLDYYIIESVFQFSFYGIKANSTFDYIDKWCPFNRKAETVKGYETYKILDTTVIAKKKPTYLEEFFEKYAPGIYSEIIKSINQWLPPFTKSDEKIAIQYFEKELKNALETSIEAIEERIKRDYETDYNSQKSEAVESYQKKIDKLYTEISNLKKEIARLDNRVNPTPAITQSTEHSQKEYSTLKDYVKKDNDPVDVFHEPSAISVYDTYSAFSITDLKKLAKQRGISYTTLKGFKKEDKDDLINMIIKTPIQPKIL
ncbi:MAG: hypothetical protein K9G61_09160 [Bacteroidales bacterium]|nr:hypothetical protein [Bacteroidales bacterium]